MTPFDAFQWLGETPFGVFLRNSTFAFALTQSAHLLGLALLGGAVIASNLAALGLLFRMTPASVIARGVARLFWVGLGISATSGLLLVSAGPLKYYSNPLFLVKLGLLAFALVLHLVVHALLKRDQERPKVPTRLAASGSLGVWLAVLIAGRWVGLI